MKKLYKPFFVVMISVIALSGIVKAADNLYEYYDGDLPPISVRANIASDECGIDNYIGSYDQNIKLLNCLEKDIPYWLDRVKNHEENPLTEEELKQVPNEVWDQLVPKVIKKVIPNESLLGGESIEETFTCLGSECDKYIGNSLLGSTPITRYKTTLSSSMTSSQTSIPVSSMTTFDSTTITMDLIGNEVYLTVEPGAKKEEITRCTGISGTSWTPCTRGLAFSGQSVSAVTANRKTHNAGSIVVMSNVHYWYTSTTNTTSTLFIGDGTTNSNPEYIWNTGQTPPRKCYYNVTTEKNVCTDDGTTTYNLVDGGSGLSASTTRAIAVTDSTIQFNTDGIINNDLDIGGFGNAIKDMYASGTVYLTVAEISGNITMSSSSRFVNDLIPNVANVWDVGSASLPWKDVWASGTLRVGDTGTTSTIYSGLETGVLNVSSSTATSTFANGVKLNGGCFEDAGGDCLGSGLKGVFISSKSRTSLNNGATAVITLPANTNELILQADEQGNSYGSFATLRKAGGIGINATTTLNISDNDSSTYYSMHWDTTAGTLTILCTGSNSNYEIDYWQ